MSQAALQSWLYSRHTATAAAPVSIRGNPIDANSASQTCPCSPEYLSRLPLFSMKRGASAAIWARWGAGERQGQSEQDRDSGRERENGNTEAEAPAPAPAFLLALLTSQHKFGNSGSYRWRWDHKPGLCIKREAGSLSSDDCGSSMLRK